MKTDYKGKKIVFSERDDNWTCYELKMTSKSLKALKKKIDNIDKKDFKRFEAYYLNYEGFKLVTVTSLAKDDGYNREAWVTDEKKSRSKVRVSSLIKATPFNEKVYKNIAALKLESSEIQAKISREQRKFVKYSMADFSDEVKQ